MVERGRAESIQNKHRHHKLPQAFLRGFAAESRNLYQKVPDIWVYKKGDAFKNGVNPTLESIKEVGYSKDFYAFKNATGDVDFNKYEDLLMKDFEQPGQPVLEKVRRFEEITEDEKHVFARYVGSMITRGDWWRRVGEKALADSVEQLTNHYLTGTNDISTKNLLKDFIRSRAEELRGGELLNEGVIRKAFDVSEILSRMVWRFVLPPKGMYFCSSDKPIFYYFLDKKDSELVFPVSSLVTLSLSWQKTLPLFGWIKKSPSYWEVDMKTAIHIRRLMAFSAIDEVYAPKRAEWLVQFINNTKS